MWSSTHSGHSYRRMLAFMGSSRRSSDWRTAAFSNHLQPPQGPRRYQATSPLVNVPLRRRFTLHTLYTWKIRFYPAEFLFGENTDSDCSEFQPWASRSVSDLLPFSTTIASQRHEAPNEGRRVPRRRSSRRPHVLVTEWGKPREANVSVSIYSSSVRFKW